MKKRSGFFMLTMWWFILLAIIGGLVVLFTPDRERISQDENRVLQNAPKFTLSSFAKGEYASKFEDFLSDSIPGRKALISISDKLTGLMSRNTDEDMYHLDNTDKEVADYQGDGSGSPDSGQPSSQNSGDENNHSSDEQDSDKSGKDAHFELVKRNGGTTPIYTYSYANIKRVAGNIEQYADLLPDDGHVYFTLVPFPKLARRFTGNLDTYSGWRCDVFDEMKKLTSDKVRYFDTLSILEPHMLEGEDLFLHGNHQWNIKGSYYVYCEMIKAQGLTPTPYDEYDYKVNHPQTGSAVTKANDTYELLYPLAPSNNYRVKNINQKEKIPFMAYNTAATSAYLYGYVQPWKTVTTGFHTGRNALVIGDCFDLSLTPFLLPYYDTVHKTDIRYIVFDRKKLGTSVADMMKRNSIDDVYFIFSEANDVNSATLLHALTDNLN